MVEKATGYLTDDGKFFEDPDLAEYHEAELDLMTRLTTSIFTNDPTEFMRALVSYREEILRYITAQKLISTYPEATANDTDQERHPSQG